MKPDFAALANPGARQIAPYIPGRPAQSLLPQEQFDSALQLASNENPLGAGSLAREAAERALSEIARYPDADAFRLRQTLAQKLGVDTARLVFGNGSNEVLILLALCFLHPGVSAVYSRHAFVVYPQAVQISGARALVAPARDWGHDLEAMLALCREDTRMVFIANPNNPTGSWVSEAELRHFLEQLPGEVLVVLDEAYCEYVRSADYPDSLALQTEFPNLVVTRSFSKIHGLAALRAGYGIAEPQITGLLQRVRQPFNLNHIAQEAACAALEDGQHLDQSRALNAEGLALLQRELPRRDLECVPSIANFLCFRAPPGCQAQALYEALLQRGVIVRPVEQVYDMPGYLRVSVGRPADNERFLAALDEALDQLQRAR